VGWTALLFLQELQFSNNASLPLYYLIIDERHLLKEVRIDEKVFKCKTSGCYQLTNIVVNEQIGHLRIQKCALVDALEKIVNWSKVVCSALFLNPERALTVDSAKDELLVAKTDKKDKESHMKSPLFSLPQDILCFIANYLLPESDQNRRIFHHSYDLRNLLNSSKGYFGKWKTESQIIVLTDSDAKRYCDFRERDVVFRDHIVKCLQSPRFQLDLVFDKRSQDNTIPVPELHCYGPWLANFCMSS
jgi:hypothetical protein